MAAGHRRSSVVVVVPALNEQGNIGSLVTELLDQPIDAVVVVDNGSGDATAVEAEAAGAAVVAEPVRGYGRACAAGAEAAREMGGSVVVFIDGDHSSRPDELPRLVEPLLADAADLVLGSRTLGVIEGGSMAPHQRFGNRLSAAVLRRLYRLNVTDLGPYRAIDAEVLRRLDMQEMTYGWPTEMTAKCARLGMRVVEVPVTWRTRRAGRSKVSGTLKGSVLAGYHILRVTLSQRPGRRRRAPADSPGRPASGGPSRAR